VLLKISSEAVTKLAGTEIFGRDDQARPKGNRLRKEEAELTDAGAGGSAKRWTKKEKRDRNNQRDSRTKAIDGCAVFHT
jgi:hypothetical protein